MIMLLESSKVSVDKDLGYVLTDWI